MARATASFRGRRYKISEDALDGICDQPEGGTPHREINVDPRCRGRVALVTWLHESFHAEWPNMSEREVAQASEDVGRLLWAKGYRRRGKDTR